jgi:cysteine desulfurase
MMQIMFIPFVHTKAKRIYLDFAAATPLRPSILKLMTPFFSEDFANPSAIHTQGVRARAAVEEARLKLARVLRIKPSGIYFTGHGTESNNIALLGVIAARHKAGVPYADMEVITTAIEHASVLRVCEHLASLGVVVKYVPVDNEGLIHAEHLARALTPKTVLMVLSYVNSEIGVIQPVAKLARIVRAFEVDTGVRIHMHLDAAQAPLWLSCALDALLVDSIALDAGKCYGPKGIGVLACTGNVDIDPIQFGGLQEGGLRPGTENTGLIVGAVAALCEAQAHYAERAGIVTGLRDYFFDLLLAIPGCVANGSRTARIANNVHISIAGMDAEFAVVSLDHAGICCATKSACGGARGEGSAVVYTLSADPARARATIRFTLGEETTKKDLDVTAQTLRVHVAKLKAAQEKLTQIQ